MVEEIEYKFLKNVNIENRVKGEFYISTTLKLAKWNGKRLASSCPIGEREKFEIWKKENKVLCMEKPEKPKIGDICTRGGVEFRYNGKDWLSEEARENNKKAKNAWNKTPEGRKSVIFARWKNRGIIFPSKKQKEKVYDCHSKATHCNNCEICELTRHPEPFSTATACLDHSYVSSFARQIICNNCNSHEAKHRREGKWKQADPKFTRFALINGEAVYLS